MTGKMIVIISGDAHTPERFFNRAVCAEEEFTEAMKDAGCRMGKDRMC